ncbi:SDR family NAD(P)-dependent oxidoreductase [Conexibacter arvalis]|uniref:NAD(P)-dependent dehydrogenase (Short-subunit alcohol dehydrogenase family) n=1 Tax=Conexibacter arvalis TaxID=912552 RepID=A0A840IBN0_9ACTN|nr:SDR family oxidoreductase [Conexibacter arvalis]MBB4661340.1 NAD(P)-dependent dehydrogenase (short-subunit alcohol dehydrogenase family) [Conexibacter arvalis]
MTAPAPLPLLHGRVALVTGGANGLGATIARTLAAAGARGVALDRDVAGATPPDGWVAHAADVTDEQALRAAVAACVERFGRLDVVVANAGVVPPWRETAAIEADEWDRVSAVNVRGVATTIAAAVPALKAAAAAPPAAAAPGPPAAQGLAAAAPPAARATASVIALASINARKAHPRQALYSATKHAVVGIVRATALDLGRDGIRVNAVAPGAIATDALLDRMARRAAAGGLAADEALAAAAGETALGRIATAEEVADAVLFLASDLASGITGQVLAVDAGVP